jgi:hypothetical protein
VVLLATWVLPDRVLADSCKGTCVVKWERNFHTFSAMLTEVGHAAAAYLVELGYGRVRLRM